MEVVIDMKMDNQETTTSNEGCRADDQGGTGRNLGIGGPIAEEELVVVESFLLPQLLKIIRTK